MIKFLIFLVLLGCGLKKEKEFYVEPDFVQYLERFEYFLGYKIDDIVIVYGDTTATLPSAIGTCTSQKILNSDLRGQRIKRTPIIKIKRNFWNKSDIPTRELLMFHELGHCILNRGHRTVKGSTFPVSIMEPVIFSSFVYVKDYSYYISELFGTKKDGDLTFDFFWYD